MIKDQSLPAIPTTPNQTLPSESNFTCACSKVYKSYAAVYTHIKNKHQNQFEMYKKQIKRPINARSEKGRPKRYPELQMDCQRRRMEVLQLGNLELWQKVQKINLNKRILGPYDDYDEKQVQRCYREIEKSYGPRCHNILDDAQNVFDSFKQFFMAFCKHWNYDMAGKILWTLNDAISLKSQQSMGQLVESQSQKKLVKKIWLGLEGMSQFLMGIYQKWKMC